MNRSIELFYCSDQVGDMIKDLLDEKGISYILTSCSIGDSYLVVNGEILDRFKMKMFIDSLRG